MGSMLQRQFADFIGWLSGPLQLRLFLQPGMALLLGIRDVLKDFHANQPPYFWSIFTTPSRRMELVKNGLKSVAKVMVSAIVMDAIYQFVVLRWFYPGEASLVVFVLAFVPYLLIRGPVNRMAKWWASRHSPGRRSPQ
jgi:hypothetical protein